MDGGQIQGSSYRNSGLGRFGSATSGYTPATYTPQQFTPRTFNSGTVPLSSAGAGGRVQGGVGGAVSPPQGSSTPGAARGESSPYTINGTGGGDSAIGNLGLTAASGSRYGGLLGGIFGVGSGLGALGGAGIGAASEYGRAQDPTRVTSINATNGSDSMDNAYRSGGGSSPGFGSSSSTGSGSVPSYYTNGGYTGYGPGYTAGSNTPTYATDQNGNYTNAGRPTDQNGNYTDAGPGSGGSGSGGSGGGK